MTRARTAFQAIACVTLCLLAVYGQASSVPRKTDGDDPHGSHRTAHIPQIKHRPLEDRPVVVSRTDHYLAMHIDAGPS